MVTTIWQKDENRIAIRCHYTYRKRCHDIPGAEFDKKRRVWIAPVESLPYIQREFDGEVYYKTPLWRLLGHEAPPKEEEMRFLGPVPNVPDLSLKPYDYQAEGIQFMIDRLNNVGFVLNGDSVGLGKTLQAIGTMKWFVEQRGARKILIICKKSIKSQWRDEIRRIAGRQSAPIFITGSTKKKRLDAYKGINESQIGILITNYHNYLYDFDEINKTNYDICVIDEAHCIKGRDGKMNKLIGDTVSGKRTILLTGTPIMSRPDDIWGITHMVAPDYFGTYEEFKGRYLIEELNRDRWYMELVGAKNLDELQDRIKNFLIMRSAEEVELQLPKQRRAKRLYCEMDAVQKKMQGAVQEMIEKQEFRKEEIIREYGMSSQTMTAIGQINELSKMFIASLQFIADDPGVFRYMNPEKGINKRLQAMLPAAYKKSAKTEAIIDAVSEITHADEKVIVFCHFASAARMLKAHFDKIEGANTVMYTGAESDEQRTANIDAFKTDPECRVIIGTEAMAEGLNLQVSRYVIHYEQADTYAQREQRIGRIRRIGSKYDSVNVLDIVTENSFDMTKLKKLARDKSISEAALARGLLENID